jgi:protease IV
MSSDQNEDDVNDIISENQKTMQSIHKMAALMVKSTEQGQHIQLRDIKTRQVRNWIFFAAFVVLPLIYVALGFQQFNSLTSRGDDGDYAAVVRIQGVISANEDANALSINKALTKAFADKDATGVLILINTPGGSPVQSAEIHQWLMKLRKENPDKKVAVYGADSMTSGGYMIATGADEIYVNRSTITGSIGVIMKNFGYVDIMKKVGVERRVFTAGKNKNRMDSFKPISKDDKAKFYTVLDQLHEHFIELVKETRKDKLKGPDSELFSGDFWTGEEALKLGLVDGLSDFRSVLKDKFGATRYIDYTESGSFVSNIIRRFTSEFNFPASAMSGYEFQAIQ